MKKIVKTSVEINEWFNKLDDKIDIWITDPPYPFNNKNGSGRFKYQNGKDKMYQRLSWKDLEKVFLKMYQETNHGGRAYIFCNRDGIFKLKSILDDIGWKFRNMLVWDKQAMGMGYHWRNQLEYILYVSKGSVEYYVKGEPNIFYEKKPRKKDAIPSINYYPSGTSPKPYKIWLKILRNQLGEGEIVADPFSGSNPLSAAIKMDSNIKKKIKKAYCNSF